MSEGKITYTAPPYYVAPMEERDAARDTHDDEWKLIESGVGHRHAAGDKVLQVSRNDIECPMCHTMWTFNCICMKERICARGHRIYIISMEKQPDPINGTSDFVVNFNNFTREFYKETVKCRTLSSFHKNKMGKLVVDLIHEETERETHTTSMSPDELIKEIGNDPHFQREKANLIAEYNSKLV